MFHPIKTTIDRRIIRFIAVFLFMAVPMHGLIGGPESVQAQPAAIDAIMQPKAGEKAGELAKGELLTTALKREKLEGNSIREAMQSIGKLFDFRLSRAGDKYVYKQNNGKKIVMLRYQRGQHVYEALWDEETGQYNARLVETDSIPQAIDPGVLEMADEDGEIDVEHAAVADQIKNAPTPRFEAPDVNDSFGNELANPDDPVLPEDPALAGKPSPDAEFQGDGTGNGTPILDGDSEDQNAAADDTEDDELLNAPVIVHEPTETNSQEEPQNKIVPENSYRNEPFYGNPGRPKKALEPDNAGISMISLTALILGIVLFIFAALTILWPSIQMRRRCAAQGLHIRSMIRISPRQRLACVEQDNHACLIAIQPEGMSFIAPCPVDDTAFWEYLKTKTYWHQMAQKTLSDRQLASLLREFQQRNHPSQTKTATFGKKSHSVDEQDDSTAILLTSLDDDIQSEANHENK